MKNFFLLLVLLPLALFSQERKPLNGKITSDADDLEGIYVINRTADASVTTGPGGYFTINARVNDTLIFSAIQFVAKELVVQDSHLSQELIFVPLEPMIRSLDEAVVTKSNITAESLGIVPKGQKRYTPGERKVYTATQGVDGVINAISGRKKEVKKAAEYEKKELLMDKINYIYTEEDIVNELKVPEEHVRGLIFYAIQDKEFADAIKQKNDVIAKFHLGRIATEYLELIKEDTDEE